MPTTFETGTEVAHYRLIAPLGAGGMGEVYKAHDSRLERTIALKILPPELVRNDERVRRFVQEAKSASSLNHPNIVTIHEIGHVDSGGQPIHYIAMELIDGATLRRKIHEEGTDLRTLLVYLAQAADGLAKAHAAGIIHRDLKPENIMVTRDGFAKVLDFGLAKLSVKKSSDNMSEATAVRQQTRDGAILGTVSYMSPEQVQGKPVDHRSDIFSFGCILYEAATRRRPFEADSDVDVMHQIIHDKPVPIDEINPAVPAELRRVIRRCMAKDPEKRYQSMKDLALELTDIVDEFEELSASATSASHSVSAEVLASMPGQRRTFRVMLGALGLVALIAIGLSIYLWRQTRARNAAASYSSMKISRLTSSGNVAQVAVSPDGKYVAQVLRDGAGHWVLSMRQIATGSDVPVIPPSPTPIGFLTFSRDGNYLFYAQSESESGSGYGSLFTVPALGGAPRKIVFDIDSPVSFSPDGSRIAFGRGFPPEGKNAVVIANADGTGAKELVRFDRLGWSPTAACWSPDGTKIITAARSLAGGVHAEVVEIDVATGKVRSTNTKWRFIDQLTLLPDGSGAVIAALSVDGAGDQQIWLQPLDDAPPVRITNDLNQYGWPAVTSDGHTLSAIASAVNADVFVCDATDPSGGAPFSPSTADQTPADLAVAPAGVIAYTVTGQGLNVAIIDHPGGAPRLLTSDNVSLRPSLAADGKTMVFQSRRDQGIPGVFFCDADGTNVRKIAAGARPAISPDGRLVLFITPDSGLWRVASSGGSPQKVSDRVAGGFAINHAGTQVAYTYWKLEGNHNTQHLIVAPIAGGSPLFDSPFSNTGEIEFTPKDDGIAYIRDQAGTSNVWVLPLKGGPHTQLTKFGKGAIDSFGFAADGKLVLVRGEVKSNAVLISNFR